jgi:hypothetical protein
MPVHNWGLVDPGVFHSFHGTWIGELLRVLNRGLLPEGYYALGDAIAGEIGPDVLTLNSRADGNGPLRPFASSEDTAGAAGGVATLAPPQVELTFRAEEEIYTRRRRTVIIRHRSGDRVVATIEILSHGNKASQHEFNSFLAKCENGLRHGVHLLLIDLHPRTPRDPGGIHAALWQRMTGAVIDPDPRPLTLGAYPAAFPWVAYVQPLAVGQALRDMPLYLTPDFYVSVPLEPTYTAAFDGVPPNARQILEA